VRRGSREDFWRSVKLGLGLADKGWVPSILEISRPLTVTVNGHRCKVHLRAYLDHRGCHAGGMIWLPKGTRLTRSSLERALRGVAGPGIISENSVRIDLRRGFSRLEDLTRPMRVRRERSILAPARLSRLIRRVQGWLRSHERSGWSGQSVLFRRLRSFHAEGLKWKWFSDLYFYRGEGLYWNNFLTSMDVDRSTFRWLLKKGFYDRVGKDLERHGFRVSPPHPSGVVFDDNYPSTGVVIQRIKAMDRWKAPSR
jgi:hypothetical protein